MIAAVSAASIVTQRGATSSPILRLSAVNITSGTSNGSPHLSAGAGYDLVTGRGTPFADKVVADLVGSTVITPAATHFSVTAAPASSVAGTAFSVTVTALDANGNLVPGYLGTVSLASCRRTGALKPPATLLSIATGVSVPF